MKIELKVENIGSGVLSYSSIVCFVCLLGDTGTNFEIAFFYITVSINVHFGTATAGNR